MKQWLAFADRRGSDWVNFEVLFIEKPEEEEGGEEQAKARDEDVKPQIVEWDVAVIMVVLSKLKDPEILWIQLESLSKLPADAFASPNLKSVRNLELPVPLTSSLNRPSFILDSLFLDDRVPLPENYGKCCGKLHICCKCGSQHHGALNCQLVRWGLPADWTNTIRLLAPPPYASSSERLDYLSLLHFPYFSPYVHDLLNLVSSIRVLALPSVESWTQRSRHAVELLSGCHDLQQLYLARLPEPDITLSLFQALPRSASVQILAVEHLIGKLGAGIPEVHPQAFEYCDCEDCRLNKRDPVAELLQLLRPLSKEGVREITITGATHVSDLQVQWLEDEAQRCGIELKIVTIWTGLSCCEQSELDRLIERSTALFAQASLQD